MSVLFVARDTIVVVVLIVDIYFFWKLSSHLRGNVTSALHRALDE